VLVVAGLILSTVEAIRVVGGARLAGTVRVGGAKNCALKLMAAALLAEGTTVLLDVPDILDVDYQAELLRRLGCDVVRTHRQVSITVPAELGHRAEYDLVRRLRASINVLGPLLARGGLAEVALPGGDNIGSRGLDLHVAGLERLGATVRSEHGYLIASREDRLRGATVWLDFPSVGATENLLMAAVTAKGTTVIDNAAREPEIVDICRMLQSMGALIDGVGTSMLEIEGVDTLSATTHTTVADRLVVGTWAAAAVMTRGDVTIENADPSHLEIALDKLVVAGAFVDETDTGIRVQCYDRPRAVDIVTLPYPGFPSDLQPQFLALNAIASGAAMVTENLYEARFRFVNELVRLGADVHTDGHHAMVRGVDRLSGAPVEASDIRAGAGLVLAGLIAEGVTTVHEPYHVDRGYEHFVEDLVRLGADVSRVPVLDLPG
jgi:UDP-N-acetylglucosamine 1-carboxyvinyltransferase